MQARPEGKARTRVIMAGKELECSRKPTVEPSPESQVHQGAQEAIGVLFWSCPSEAGLGP